jgi:hypothetical protein
MHVRLVVVLGVAEDDGLCRRLGLPPEGREALTAGRPLWARAQRRFERAVGAGTSQQLRQLLSRVVAADFGRPRADR